MTVAFAAGVMCGLLFALICLWISGGPYPPQNELDPDFMYEDSLALEIGRADTTVIHEPR